jgi:chaperonin cofactor prefoldin
MVTMDEIDDPYKIIGAWIMSMSGKTSFTVEELADAYDEAEIRERTCESNLKMTTVGECIDVTCWNSQWDG